jgi:hypothetical protein
MAWPRRPSGRENAQSQSARHHRATPTWRYVADRVDNSSRGADVIDVVVPLRMVLSTEGIACRPKYPRKR